MKVSKQIITTEPCDIKIQGIGLLSKAQYDAARKNKQTIKDITQAWWLKDSDPQSPRMYHFSIHPTKGVCDNTNIDDLLAVRPVLYISDYRQAGLDIGDSFEVYGLTWTIILKGIALCDHHLGREPFRNDYKAKDVGDYESSDVKKFLDKWLSEQSGPKLLLVIDLQKDFKNPEYDDYINFIHKNRSKYDLVIGTQFKNKKDSNFCTQLGYTDCMQPFPLEYHPDKTYVKSTYAFHLPKQFEGFTVHIMGQDQEACVLATCFDLWDRGINFKVLEDFVYSPAWEEDAVDMNCVYERNFGEDIFIR